MANGGRTRQPSKTDKRGIKSNDDLVKIIPLSPVEDLEKPLKPGGRVILKPK